MKRFALIGAAGYIAPRHMRAIKDTGNVIVAALDKHDNVGVLDSYFPDCDFFVEFERFDRHVDKLRRQHDPIDYVSICSPNYLHDSHIRFALRQHADAICEKPLVLNPWNVDALAEIEKEMGKKINTILQLRLHPSIINLRETIKSGSQDKIYEIDLSYITSRGNWYHVSWKGEDTKSGGVVTNIGIHFFDMLIWVFGPVKDITILSSTNKTVSGVLKLQQARVKWLLSIDRSELPEQVRQSGKSTYRSLKMGDKEIEFSEGFTDLHTESYKHILAGHGFGLEDARPSIQLIHQIRNQLN